MKNIISIFFQFGVRDGIEIILQKIKNKFFFQINRQKTDLRPIIKVLKSGNLSSSPYPSKIVNDFTKKFLKLHDGERGICVSNGTVALSVIFKTCGIKYGDEVIMPALTFHSTASIALELGIIPVFVDVDPDNLCIDPKKIEEKISIKTKAIIVVHLGSIIADLDSIREICAKKNLKMIEDCSHAHGSKWKQKGVGSYGDLSFFSFQNSKLINAGEGGFIMINDQDHFKKCLSYVNCGRNSEPFTTLGVNHRLTEIQAVILMNSQKKFQKNIKKIDFHMSFFKKEISKINNITTLKKHDKQTLQLGYFFGLKLNEKKFDASHRKKIVYDLNNRGINSIDCLYQPVYLTPEFGWKDSPINVDYSKVICPEAEKASKKNVLWIHHSFFNQNLSSVKYGLKVLNKLINNE